MPAVGLERVLVVRAVAGWGRVDVRLDRERLAV